MVLSKRRYTFEDWLAMPDDGRRYELLNGELCEVTPPTADHARLVGILYRWLSRAEELGYGLALPGPVAVLLDATRRRENVPEPDVLFVRRDQEQVVTAVAVEGTPDLVIGILSPSNRGDDLPNGTKWDIYERSGVPNYWIVDPEARTVTQYRHEGGRFREVARLGRRDDLTSPLFPGVTLPVETLFGALRGHGR